jgi:hypothetical protein
VEIEDIQLSDRNGDHKGGSEPLLARNADVALVGADQLLDDGQADPTSGGVPDVGSPPEAVENVVEVFWGDAPP